MAEQAVFSHGGDEKHRLQDLSASDLAAYISSKVCHDIISPVGAIMNGLEVLDDEDNSDMHDFARDLIRKSATQASYKLQYARMAFGASGDPRSELDLGDAEMVARQMFESDKLKLEWTGTRIFVSKPKVKLLLNILSIAMGAIPRGGEISVTLQGGSADFSFVIICRGKNHRAPQPASDYLNGLNLGESVDAHTIQPYYTALLAQECAMTTCVEQNEDCVIFRAQSTL